MAGPTPSNQHEPIRVKWAGWLERVEDDVLAASLERVVWKQVTAAIQDQAVETPDTFLHHYCRLYAHTQSMAVRRLMLHRRPDQRSLSSLIKNFILHPDVMTREQYAAAHISPDRDDRHWLVEQAKRTFNERFGGGGEGDETLSVEKLTDDLDRIAHVCGPVTDYADNVVAHVGSSQPSVSWGELDAAIDITEEMFKRYSLLLTASSWVLPPVIQGPWRSTFDRPLFPRMER